MENRVSLERVSWRRTAFVVGALLAIILGALLFSALIAGSVSHPSVGIQSAAPAVGNAGTGATTDPYSPRDPLPAVQQGDPYSPRDPLG
jgi:hypothetical protein